MNRLFLAAALPLLLATALLSAGCDRSAAPAATNESVAVASAMGGGDTTGYARATEPRAFTFPADHGPHPGFKTEWWYLTGNLEAAGGRRFGYQFTIFRVATAPPDSASQEDATPVRLASTASAAATGNAPSDTAAASSWRTDQFYMAHLALSDVQGETHYDYERFARGAAGLAGAEAEPFRVWLEGWEMSEENATGNAGGSNATGNAGGSNAGGSNAGGDEDLFPLRVEAKAGSAGEDSIALDLRLTSVKAKVLQGERGLSQKGPGAGNASYYYSFTRLPTEGTVSVSGNAWPVSGTSWMDREWSTSALGEGQEGWDWFALQLSDGRELMYYQLRQTGGAPSQFSEGVLVGPQGQATRLTREDVTLDVLQRWTDPESGAAYPSKWRLRIPSENLDLTVTPYFEDQVMNTSVRYWEGAVRIDGEAGTTPVEGSGYVELTGYGEGNASRGALP